MRGTFWEPVFEKGRVHIPADINDNDEGPGGDRGRDVRPTEGLVDDVFVELRGGFDRFLISRKAIATYGVTPGCFVCNGPAGRGHEPSKCITIQMHVGMVVWNM